MSQSKINIIELDEKTFRTILEQDYTKEIKQKTEIRKLRTSLEKFVYSASHDLRSPLTSLLGLIQLVQAEKDEKQREICLDLMKTNIQKLDTLIKDIVSISQSSALSPIIEKINIPMYLGKALTDFASDHNMEGVKYNFTFEGVGDFFYTDKEKLRFIIRNLVANSVKYRDRAKQDPCINILAKLENDTLMLEVKDNGIGIEEVHIHKIFDMFYRAHHIGVGSGLGLHIVKTATDTLGGSISVVSKVSTGSTFTIMLPNHDSTVKGSV